MEQISSLVITNFIFLIIVATNGIRFEFVFDNDEVFDICSEYPGTKGIADLFDQSEMSFVFNEGSIRVTGNMTCVWQGVQPTDRIDARVELYKFSRSAWQPTPFSSYQISFCDTQFDKKGIFYQVWTKYIIESDRKCINNNGHVYHHHTYDINTIVDFPIYMNGRHKIVVIHTAYNEYNLPRLQKICYQFLGEFFKV